MTDRRLGITSRQHFVSTAMAVLTSGSRRTNLARDSVRAMRVSILRFGVALRATYLGWRSLMRKALHVLVAINTTEHASMDRVFQFALVHKKADLLSVHIFCQRIVGVTDKAISVFKLLSGTCGEGPNQKQ